MTKVIVAGLLLAGWGMAFLYATLPWEEATIVSVAIPSCVWAMFVIINWSANKV